MSLPYGWWRNEEHLRRELGEHGSLQAAALAHGANPSTVQKGWRLTVGETHDRVGQKAHLHLVKPGEEKDAWLLGVLKKLGDEATVEQLADEADISPRKVREALERLGHDGFRVSENQSRVVLERAPRETGTHWTATPELFDGDLFRFAVVSDVHLGSQAERLDELHTAYDVIQAEGIATVFNPGDLTDGMGIYRGQISEVLHHTYEAQKDHAAEAYPARPGVTTRIIAGNHDLEGEFGRVGADPVQAVCNVRDDMEYLGRYSAWVDLPNGATMHIVHPMGGASYATSYRAQKHAESYEGGSKPNVLLLGHWHRQGYFQSRGIQILLAGTFQGPTTYSTRKAFGEPGFGFWIVECRLADDGSVVQFNPRWMPYYAGRTVA